MVMLVEVDQVKTRLRITIDDEDDDLELAVESASGAVLNYLRLETDAYDDSGGEVALDLVPAVVKQAVITLVGIWKRDPAGVDMAQWQGGYLPAPVTAILYPLRSPAIA